MRNIFHFTYIIFIYILFLPTNNHRPTSTLGSVPGGLSVAGLNDFVTRRDGESVF
jgi:hypothetical protein